MVWTKVVTGGESEEWLSSWNILKVGVERTFSGRSDVVSERKGRVKGITEALSQNNGKNEFYNGETGGAGEDDAGGMIRSSSLHLLVL